MPRPDITAEDYLQLHCFAQYSLKAQEQNCIFGAQIK